MLTTEDLYNIKEYTDFYKLKTNELGNVIDNYKQKIKNISEEEEKRDVITQEFKKIYQEGVRELLNYTYDAIPKLELMCDKTSEKDEKTGILNILDAYVKTRDRLEKYLNIKK